MYYQDNLRVVFTAYAAAFRFLDGIGLFSYQITHFIDILVDALRFGNLIIACPFLLYVLFFSCSWGKQGSRRG